MNLQQLRYFQTIAKYENITRAAETLFVAQSGLSHSIADLERELKIQLFNRCGRNIKLTLHGKEFLNYVDKVLQTLDDGIEAMKKFNSHSQVSLAFGASQNRYFIPNLIRSFRSDPLNGDIHFILQESTTLNIIDKLANDKIDFGIGGWLDISKFEALLQHHSIEYNYLYQEKMRFIVPKGHPWEHADSISIKDLANEKYIAYSKECTLRISIDEIFKSLKINPEITQEAYLDTAIASRVAAGIGIGIVPSSLDFLNMSISAVDIKEQDLFMLKFYLLRPKNKPLTISSTQFYNFILCDLLIDSPHPGSVPYLLTYIEK